MTKAQEFLNQFPAAIEAAKVHARASYPEESCGFIVDGSYVGMSNQALDPAMHDAGSQNCQCRLCAFAIDDAEYLSFESKIQAIVHSHPNGPAYPSKSDMAHQESSDVAWIIVTLDETRFGPLTVWGGNCPIEPLIGREFIHGINDCYSAIRDTFALGREKLAEQDIGWPFPPINLPLYPRQDAWWESNEDNFYEEKPHEIGFVEISMNDVRPGDVFLGKIRSDRLNHGGVMLENHLILHHLPQRLSRREPAGIWARCAEKWLRYESAAHA